MLKLQREKHSSVLVYIGNKFLWINLYDLALRTCSSVDRHLLDQGYVGFVKYMERVCQTKDTNLEEQKNSADSSQTQKTQFL